MGRKKVKFITFESSYITISRDFSKKKLKLLKKIHKLREIKDNGVILLLNERKKYKDPYIGSVYLPPEKVLIHIDKPRTQKDLRDLISFPLV